MYRLFSHHRVHCHLPRRQFSIFLFCIPSSQLQKNWREYWHVCNDELCKWIPTVTACRAAHHNAACFWPKGMAEWPCPCRQSGLKPVLCPQTPGPWAWSIANRGEGTLQITGKGISPNKNNQEVTSLTMELREYEPTTLEQVQQGGETDVWRYGNIC